jgi:hypothetical protein
MMRGIVIRSIYSLCGEVTVAGIVLQQSLALQITSNAGRSNSNRAILLCEL